MHNTAVTFNAFYAAYGPGPWPCYFSCDKLVHEMRSGRKSSSGVVHHIDEDHTNDEPSNLAAAHYGCHSRAHATDPTVATRDKRRVALLGHPFWGRRTTTPEIRARMSEAAKRRWARERSEA